METWRKINNGPKFGALWDGDDPAPAQTTSVSTSQPPAFLQPFLADLAQRAQDQSQQPREFFPGQTFSEQAPETELGLQLQTQRAITGSPTTAAANTQLQQTLGGDFLENPFTDQLTSSIVNAVRPAIDSQFAGAGVGGLSSGLRANALTGAVTDRLAPLQFQQFQNERGNQLRAAQLAPTLGQEDFRDAAALAEVGAAREGFTQQGIQEDINRFNFGQVEPIERLGTLAGLLGQTNFGGVSTSQSSAQQPGTSQLGNIAGAGLGGLGILGLLNPFNIFGS